MLSQNGETRMTQEPLAWFAGVDWDSERHQACVVDAQGNIAGEREFLQSGAVWRNWAIGCSRSPVWPAVLRWRSKYRMARLSTRCLIVASLPTRSIPSSWTAYATGSASPGRRPALGLEPRDHRRDAYVLADGVR